MDNLSYATIKEIATCLHRRSSCRPSQKVLDLVHAPNKTGPSHADAKIVFFEKKTVRMIKKVNQQQQNFARSKKVNNMLSEGQKQMFVENDRKGDPSKRQA